MATVGLVGSTGLVGSHILSLLAKSAAIGRINVFCRRKLPLQSKVHAVEDADSSKWASSYPDGNQVFFSALGTTARIAGSFANQRKIDYDLNLELAQVAFASGTKIYVLVSTSGASPTSMVAYSRMKGELDEAIKTIGFQNVIIMKPGLLVGTRQDSRPGEYAARQVASFLGAISGNRLKDTWAQDAGTVARAAVAAALEALDGRNVDKVRVVKQSEIVKMGRLNAGD